MTLKEVRKKEAGKDFDILWWYKYPKGSAPQKLLCNEIYDLIKILWKIVGDSGGYICAPTHRVNNDVPIENIMAYDRCL